jgi:hypothetical protein
METAAPNGGSLYIAAAGGDARSASKYADLRE